MSVSRYGRGNTPMPIKDGRHAAVPDNPLHTMTGGAAGTDKHPPASQPTVLHVGCVAFAVHDFCPVLSLSLASLTMAREVGSQLCTLSSTRSRARLLSFHRSALILPA